MTDKLSDWGYNFQIKLVAALFTDRLFLQQISDILDRKFFESESNQFIIGIILDYFQEYKDAPTMEVFKVKLDELDNDLLVQTIKSHLKDVYKQFEATDLEFIKGKTLDFCKNQALKKAIVESVELLQVGEFEQIKVKIDEAMKAGVEKNLGHDYNEEVEIRYQESSRSPISTGWDVIDDLADGGLGKGELGVMVAPAGIGKSWALINVGANAVKAGLNVIHYTLELNEHYVGMRYDAVFTGIANQDLRYHQDDVKKMVDSLDGSLTIKYYPTKGAGITTLAAHLERCRINDKKPDLIIVDYADLLRGVRGLEKRHELGNIYEDLRGMAGEYQIPIWTASQANRSALQEDVIQADKIAEDYSKIMTADLVISLSRKIEDKIAGTGRWHIIKNRFGPDGITLPSKINASNGKMEIFEANTVQGQETQQQINGSSEFMRKMLAQKFTELNNDKPSGI
jgi:replicative DNA helicase